MSTPSKIQELLVTDGICKINDLYDGQDIKHINRLLDELFASKSSEPRSYAKIDDFYALGLLPSIFSSEMCDLLFSIIDDAVLYHCHVYEIAGNSTKSHIFSETLNGFHRDPDSEWHADDPSHVSIFVYLTDVENESGPFEFVPQSPMKWLTSKTPVVTMTGPAGSSFAWNRSFFHRAAPNRSPIRRRLLKLSIQHNKTQSAHINDAPFKAVRAAGVAAGDPRLGMLIGEYQERSKPSLPQPGEFRVERVEPHSRLEVSAAALTKANLRMSAKRLKTSVLGEPQAEKAAYD